MSSGRFADKVVLVTGAGSGIGRATALAFAREGADLVLCDVNEASLEEVSAATRAQGRRALARKVDVSSAAAMQSFADEVHAALSGVDVIVNNAGVAVAGGLRDTTLDDWNWVMGINVMGVVHGCHFFVPRMIERGRGGHVVNIASAAGLAGSRLLLAYATTKFAVVGFSEALREDLRRHRIGVSAICPGFIRTNINEAGRRRGRFAEPAAIERSRRLMERGASPELVAGRIMDAVEQNLGLVPVTKEAHLAYALKRVSPNLLGAIWRRLEAWQAPEL
ncbi:SDR family NAD(P)-dependent oxidoreductase [Polyangium spumosum]|uniref:SDR family NAD(P)-dependent oxidoreductase n=1 Tax=Polyangium spumosum TaxID=889282 RepID=A0A6N7Q8B7_9BACT|nr:SDR family NAD(P)-dependent oxidoreductase [Polyangium spumosum]MRG97111.1 SDR family NAD(P)-dependent oxidoreductase [Polyangium spumosum]